MRASREIHTSWQKNHAVRVILQEAPEKEWRAIVAAQAQALIERLKAAGVEAPALRSPRQ
jgi:rRNA-processing protein FCF1